MKALEYKLFFLAIHSVFAGLSIALGSLNYLTENSIGWTIFFSISFLFNSFFAFGNAYLIKNKKYSYDQNKI